MAFNDYKEQLKDGLSTVAAKILENPTFNTLKEKYDILPHSQQRLLILGLAAVVAFSLVMIPLGHFSSSQENEQAFLENRDLLERLLKATTVTTASSDRIGFSANRVIANIRSSLSTEVQEDQIKTIESFNLTQKPKFIPKQIDTEAVRVLLNKLNLNQIVKIGHSLQNLTTNSQLLNISIQADSKDNHFYNVTYELVGFKIKPQPEKTNEKKSRKKRQGR